MFTSKFYNNSFKNRWRFIIILAAKAAQTIKRTSKKKLKKPLN